MKWPIVLFTLPFNLRDPKETKGVVKFSIPSAGLLIMPVVGAHSDPDPQVMKLLTDIFSPDLPPTAKYYLEVKTQELSIRHHLFFKHLFDAVRETIDALEMTEIIHPQGWQRHFSDKVTNQGEMMSNRKVLYLL